MKPWILEIFIKIIMALLTFILVVIYILSTFGLIAYYGEHNVVPNIWSVTSVFLPIVNTIVALYIMVINRKDMKMKRFFSLREYLDDLKNN